MMVTRRASRSALIHLRNHPLRHPLTPIPFSSSTSRTFSSTITLSNNTLSTSQPDLIDELQSRGLIQTLTSRSLRTHLSTASRTVYSGVDPSAPSLHVGNLLPLLTLAHFSRYGHTPIVLVGGATGSIGDPSGRSTERNALDPEALQHNVDSISSQLSSFFANVGGEVKMMNNLDWTRDVTLLDFLGTVGRRARLTTMLSRESVSSRLNPTSGGDGGMSYTEFSYQLLQAYDFSHLHSHHSCTVQIGGSDQLGNITAGIDLIRRTAGLTQEEPAFGLTLPLLTTSGGEKFGKSAGNAVWLDPSLTSDMEFYQFFLRTSDADVGRYLKALTLMEMSEAEQVLREHKGKEKERRAQRRLADEITTLIRGKGAAGKCAQLSSILFSNTTQAAREALSRLNLSSITEQDGILASLRKDEVVGADITKLVVQVGLVKSRGEAKRLLSAGGLYVNNERVKEERGVKDSDLVAATGGRGGLCLLRAGKGAVKVLHVT